MTERPLVMLLLLVARIIHTTNSVVGLVYEITAEAERTDGGTANHELGAVVTRREMDLTPTGIRLEPLIPCLDTGRRRRRRPSVCLFLLRRESEVRLSASTRETWRGCAEAASGY